MSNYELTSREGCRSFETVEALDNFIYGTQRPKHGFSVRHDGREFMRHEVHVRVQIDSTTILIVLATVSLFSIPFFY